MTTTMTRRPRSAWLPGLVLTCWALAAAQAQGADPVREQRRATPSEVTATDALRQPPLSDAMQRAVRQAGGPMQAILNAARSSRKPAEPAVPVDDIGAARIALLPARAVAALSPPLNEAPAAALPDRRFDGRAATAADEASAPIVAEVTLASVLQRSAAPGAPADAIPSAGSLAVRLPSSVGPSSPAALPLPLDTPQAPPVAPRLRHLVEPALGGRWLPEALRLGKVVVDLQLQADGAVASARVAPSVPRGLARLVLDAAQQWTFEPLAQAQRHQVELVFKPES